MATHYEQFVPMSFGGRGQVLESPDAVLCRVRRNITAAGIRGGRSWEEFFEMSDKNRDGQLSYAELHALVRETLRVPSGTITDHEMKVLFNDMDKGNSGTVDAAELIEYVQHGPRRPEDRDAKLKHRMERVRRNLRMSFQAIGGNDMDERKIFAYMDLDGNTRLSQYEFNMFVRRDLGLSRWDIQNAALSEFFARMDRNANGTVELLELVDFVRLTTKDRKLGLGAQQLYVPPDTPKIERKRKTYKQKLADDLTLHKSTSLPSLRTSCFTNLGREKKAFMR